MHMHTLKYNKNYGVFSENGEWRLDLDAGTKLVSSSHNSWATRLVFKRLDGESSGTVSSEHVVGIFSEDGRYRLDIGSGSMSQNNPADTNNNTTRFVIKRLDGANSGEIHYSHVVGIYSEDGEYRLDIGAVKKAAPKERDSWATRLQVIDINKTGLVNGVYWCARDLSGFPFGNHHFILIVDTKAHLGYMGLPAREEDGVYFTTLGATKQGGITNWNGKLVAYFDDKGDVKSVREHIDPDEHTSWWKSDLDFEGKLVKCNPNFTRKVALYAVNYSRRKPEELPEYFAHDENCAAWVNTLLAVAGVSEKRRKELGDKSGIDWGENDEIDRNLFNKPS